MALKQFPLILFLLISSLFFRLAHAEYFTNYVVYYSDKASIWDFSPYQLIILDSDFHPPITPLYERKKTVIGYLSLGEIEDYRFYFNQLKDAGLILEENKNWKGSYFIDIRHPLWTRLVIEKIIPNILTQKFQGLMLDTLDDAEYLESQNPTKYAGMKKAALELVKAIRRHYPDIYLMVNRSFYLLPEVGKSVNGVLAESLYTTYNFTNKTYEFVDEKTYSKTLSILKNAMEVDENLQIFSLDYWDPEDKKTVMEIYAKERRNGFVPYVSTINLDQIYEEPR